MSWILQVLCHQDLRNLMAQYACIYSYRPFSIYSLNFIKCVTRKQIMTSMDLVFVGTIPSSVQCHSTVDHLFREDMEKWFGGFQTYWRCQLNLVERLWLNYMKSLTVNNIYIRKLLNSKYPFTVYIKSTHNQLGASMLHRDWKFLRTKCQLMLEQKGTN